MNTYKPFLELILEHADFDQGRLKHVGLKAVNPDFTSRNGFRWAFPGHWTRDPADNGSHTTEVCPTKPGDGLSVAKTTVGMAQGGYQPRTVLVVGFDRILAEDSDKWKVPEAKTLTVVDGFKIIRNHATGANLARANLSGADLSRANLSGAYLSGADLSRANGYRADLSRADLSRADLSRAYLSGANLSGAYLSGADLSGAYRYRADLSRADLSGAYLSGADLSGANGRDDWDALVGKGAIR